MKTRNHFTKIVFTVAIIIFLSATNPQDAFADDGWRDLAGSWFVDVTPTAVPGGPLLPPFTNLATFHWEGTIINSDSVFGVGHGVWKRTGKRGFKIKFFALLPPPPLHPSLPPFLANTTFEATALMTVGDSGDEADGTVTAEWWSATAGLVFWVIADVHFTRIEVD